jgi:urate oxidase
MKLVAHRYGKARVRLLKILRDEQRHSIIEIDVKAMLAGDFEASYLAGDNSKVVPTDTVRNTINVLAAERLGEEIEPFAIVLAAHFLGRYSQVQVATIEIEQRDWRRMEIDEKPHSHSFLAGSEAKIKTRVVQARHEKPVVQSGIRDLVMLKSTASGFENYPRDEFTTLPATGDRILATSFSATWTFGTAPTSYRFANETILSSMLKIFATNYSPSAQTTLFQMAEAALVACPEISRIELVMPNKHYLLVNLSPFGRDNKNIVFTPTDDPHGQIEATVTRGD